MKLLVRRIDLGNRPSTRSFTQSRSRHAAHALTWPSSRLAKVHWLRPEQLAELYRTLAARTRPGGVFINGDHLALADARLASLGAAVTDGDVARAGVGERENWSGWWTAALTDERLTALAATRGNVAAKEDLTGGTDGRKYDSNRFA